MCRILCEKRYIFADNHLYKATRLEGRRNAGTHAYAMLHYRTLDCESGHSFAGGICAPQPMLTGLGECAWCIEQG